MLCAAAVTCGLAALAIVPAGQVDAAPSSEFSRVIAAKALLGTAPANRRRGARLVTVRATAEHPLPRRRGRETTVSARVRVVGRTGRVLAAGRTSQTRELPTEGPDPLRQVYDMALTPRDSRAVRRAAAKPRTRVRVVATVAGGRAAARSARAPATGATATAVQHALQVQQTDGRLAYAADLGPGPNPPTTGSLSSLNTVTGETSQAAAPTGVSPNQVIVGLQNELLVATGQGAFEVPSLGSSSWTQLLNSGSGSCGVPQIALSPDGRYLAMTIPGCVSQVYVYDLDTGQVYAVDAPADTMYSVAFSGDGAWLYAVYRPGGLINWRLSQWSLSSIVNGNPQRSTYDLGHTPHGMGPIALFGDQVVMAETDNKLYVAPQDLSSQDEIQVVDFGDTVNVDPGWLSPTPPQPGQYLYIGGAQPNLGCYDGQNVSACSNPVEGSTGAAVMAPGSTTNAPGVPPASGLIIAGDVGGEGGTAIYQLETTGATNTQVREFTGFFQAADVGITPHASPTISIATPQVDNLTVNLDASQSVSDDGSVLTYSWDFGDGTTGTGAQVSHTYQQAGSYQVTLTVDDGENCPAGVVSDGTNILCAGPSQVSQQVQVQTTAPTFAASPDPVGFGNVWVNESGAETVTVTNSGAGSLQIGQVTTSGEPFTVSDDACSNQSIAANGGTCTLEVTFAPSAAQDYQGELSFPTNVPGQPTETIALSGTGIEPGFAVSPDPVEFGNVWVNETWTEIVTVTNTGNGVLDVGQIASSGAPFTVSDDQCSGRPVAPNGGTCTLQVTFAPTAVQDYQGQLSFPFNSPDIEPKTLDLTGTGVEPGFAVSPDPVGFGEVPVNAALSEELTVTNTGNGVLNVGQIASSGAPFTLTDDQCSGQPVAPAGSCTLRVTFSPTAAQDYSGRLDFPFNSPDISAKRVALTGTGVEPGFHASPESLAFGDVVVGQASTGSVQVSNTGRAALRIGDLSVSGPGFSLAGGDCAGATVEPGAGCTAQAAFTPQVTGPAQGELRFATNVPGQPTQTVALGGAGVSLVPVPPVFPTTQLGITNRVNQRRGTVGRPLTYTLVVTNTGPSTATGVEVTDKLSVPGTVLSATSNAAAVASLTGAPATCTSTLPVSCSLGALPPGGRVAIKVVVIPAAPGKVRNTATVNAAGVDPETANNVDAVTVSVAKPALRLAMRASRTSVAAGQTIAYTIRVTNPIGLALRRVRTCDSLPAGLAYVSSNARAKLAKGRLCWTTRRLGPHKTIAYKLTARALNGGGRNTNRASASSPDARSGRARSTVTVRRREVRGGGVTG
jgi:uncharacterized repeat protein (TIGR01451 family)